MSTPLMDAVERYLAKETSRFHMPGHKGAPLPPFGDALRYDVTEVAGTDSLYAPTEAIADAEARYARLYGAAGSLLSAGGSTLCIQTMLALVGKPGDSILCGRGVHAAAIYAMALLDLSPVWMFPETDRATGLARAITPAQVETALCVCPQAAAVYLTSPDYFGVTADIAAISAVCRRYGVPLLADNAHGAHLAFLRPNRHPLALGADMCCDSLHKTLPVLTGGALLHIANPRFLSGAKRCMHLFGSTSPSYLILLSADAALPWLEREAAPSLRRAAAQIAELEALAAARGFLSPTDKGEPLRLSLGYSPSGMEADAFRRHLDLCQVEPEYLSEHFCVFLAGAHNSKADFERLREVLDRLPQGAAEPPAPVCFPRAPEQAVSLREAVLGCPHETVSIDDAPGRVCAGTVSPCPPGVPLAVPGERLDNFLCALLKKCGISFVDVLK